MAYEFRRVDFKLFDFHLTLDPLLDAATLNPVAGFLADPAKYRAQFIAKPVSAGAFRIRPLKKKSRTHHRFWQYYARGFGQFDPWALMVPFLCEPTQYKLDVTAPRKGIRAFARPAVYLFPFGWSTTIEMSLHGKGMTPAELRDFTGSLRTQPDGPFLLDGKPMGLSAVFKKYGEELKKACFKEGTDALDLRRVDRHLVISLSQFDGDILYYKPRHDGDPQMQVADKAALHEILLGQAVSPAAVVASDGKADGQGRFLFTRFANAGFALTYFDVGTLLFVQNKAKSKTYSEAMGCHSTNVMSSMMVLQSLQSLYDFPEAKSAPAGSLVAQTRSNARQRIVALPTRYKNAVLSRWCKCYAPVQRIIAEDEPPKPKDGKDKG